MNFFRKNTLVIIIGIILFSLLTVWLGASYYLYTQSTKVIYETEHSKDLKFNLPTTQDYTSLKSGEKIDVLSINNQSSSQYILYLHGNWGRLPGLMESMSKYANVVSVSDPGYSQSTGNSDTDKVNATAVAGIDWLRAKGIADNRITVIGHSLGGSPSIYLATQYPNLNRVVTINSFFSMQKMCEIQYKILCIFAGDIHPSNKYAPNIKANFIQVHSTEDEFIPYTQGKELNKLITAKNYFVDIKGKHGGPNFDEVVKNIRAIPDNSSFLL